MSKIPAWLIGKTITGRRQFILHCRRPRFFGEIFDADDGGQTIEVIEWIDPPDMAEPDIEMKLARLLRKAGEFLAEYNKRIDNDE